MQQGIDTSTSKSQSHAQIPQGHTPGPWVAIHEPGHVAGELTDNGGYRIDAEGVEQLAFVWALNRRMPADGRPQADGPNFGSVQAGANARLIAAAPDLLRELKQSRHYIKAILDRCPPGPENLKVKSDLDALDAVIAKAEGRGSPVANSPNNGEAMVP